MGVDVDGMLGALTMKCDLEVGVAVGDGIPIDIVSGPLAAAIVLRLLPTGA